ncbi:MAG: DUF2934 domain-containing protein [Phycisphaerales bacterium]
MAKPTTKAAPASTPPAAKPGSPAASLETKPSSKGGGPVSVTREAIAQAAYLRWQKFGGDPEANWLAAERELAAR